LGRGVNRGEVWLAEVGHKRRPVLILTRSEVLDVRALVTVAEITTAARSTITRPASTNPLSSTAMGCTLCL